MHVNAVLDKRSNVKPNTRPRADHTLTARNQRIARTLVAVLLTLATAPRVNGAERPVMPVTNNNELLRHVQDIPALVAQRRLTPAQIPNPHWRADGCTACHTGKPTKAAPRLRDADTERLCNVCHEALAPHSYIHPVGMPMPPAMARRAPKSFADAVKRGGGNVTCVTCHDPPAQCLPERAKERALNPAFFREGPYRDRTELCFRCHDAEAYARLNPHDQIDAQGRPREQRCLICHQSVPRAQDGGAMKVDFAVAGDLTKLCTGCHVWVPHPGGAFAFSSKEGPNHLVAPSAGVARRMQQAAQAQGITLPLDPNNGKVYCGTCHNVHAQGVLQGAAARGAESKNRLRAPQLCVTCHDK